MPTRACTKDRKKVPRLRVFVTSFVKALTWSQPPSRIFACTLSSRAWLDSSWHGDGTSTTQVAAAHHKTPGPKEITLEDHICTQTPLLGEIWSRNSAQKLKKIVPGLEGAFAEEYKRRKTVTRVHNFRIKYAITIPHAINTRDSHSKHNTRTSSMQGFFPPIHAAIISLVSY
jgi:hypothetical protein